jgi:hypothetical protein
MTAATANPSGWRRGLGARLVLGLWSLFAAASCQNFPGTDPRPAFLPFDLRSHVQEGEVTLRDGEETLVRYVRPFQEPPRLVLVELRQSQFAEKPYRKADFQIVRQDATGFTVRNGHGERPADSWAIIKWRAEGTPADHPPAAAPAPAAPESLSDRVARLGGKVTRDPALPGGPVVGIDLHGTQTGDADLEPLRGLTSLRTLNLYGTRVTDAGLQHLSGLTGLQALHLNDTRVTDEGLRHLQGLAQLRELGLYRTGVTDAGLSTLRGLNGLQSLTLSGAAITDRGLDPLKGVRALKQLFLYDTRVTAAGVAELKRALPNVQVLLAPIRSGT